MPSSFTHLHLHTEYSLLDGLCQVEPLIARAKELGMDSLGLTDHGALHATIEFYSAATRAGVKPIIGIEAYLARGSRHDKTSGDKQPYHMTILAKNETGYRNLLKLATIANLEGYYYKPRIDKDLLQRHGEGLICFSGCLNGEIPKLIQSGRLDEARTTTRWYRELLGDDFYLELQHHDNIPELVEVNKTLLSLGREMDVPFVATNDVHYIRQEDHSAQDVLLCVQTNSMIDQANRLKMSDPSYYLRSAEEMEQRFSHVPEAILNTRRIADKCNLAIDLSKPHLPRYPVPEGKTADAYLAELCQEGLRRRYGVVTDELQRRLEYELDVIRKTKFSDYFLVVWQITSFAREHGILMGVRGSAAASLVLYSLHITNVDPLKYRLVFERFLNIERKEMPDIDMDFQDDRRDEVMQFVLRQYGADKVAQIITFGTMGAKAVLRDVGRVQGLAYADVDGVARLIPAGYRKAEKGQIKAWTIEDALALIPEFKEKYDSDYVIKNLVDTGQKLEGVVRNSGTHAAGVVISDEPLVNYVPLQRPLKGEGISVTQFSMEAIAKLGLLKMDFLGLVNLTILQRTRRYISETRGAEVDLLKVPLDDHKTFEMLSSGDTTGVFQLESTGMRRYVKELRPSSLGDLSAMIALYRPGPLEQIPNFIDSKHGKRAVSYPHPILKEILEETYGIIVYQDQVLLILQKVAGYSLGGADIVRKAMGKKIAELMQKESSRFIEGAQKQGFSAELAQQVWDLIEPFAGYAFNKAHSVSYALIAYWTAYFKANYPAEYMAAVLTCFQGATEKVATTVLECKRLGIPVLPPDINRSQVGFIVEKNGGAPAIRFGLGAIKNVGETAVKPLLDEVKARGPFKDLQDFCRRADVKGLNRRTLESLVKVGALDAMGPRGGLLASAERILSISSQQARLRDSGQSTMFDLFGATVPVPMPDIQVSPEDDDVSASERAVWEKELLGLSVTADDPLTRVAQTLGREVTFCGQIDADMEGHQVLVAGRVSAVRLLQTKRDQRSFAIATLEDLQGSVEITVWPNVYEKTAALWQQDAIVVVKGKVRVRNDQPSVACDEVKSLEQATAEAKATQAESDRDVAGIDPSLVADAVPAAVAVQEGGRPPRRPEEPALPREMRQPVAAGAHQRADAGANGDISNRQAGVAPPLAPPVGPPKTLWLTIYETDDEQADLSRLKHLFGFLRDYPGRDSVRLNVLSGGGSTRLDPSFTIAASDDLVRRLVDMLGANAIKVT